MEIEKAQMGENVDETPNQAQDQFLTFILGAETYGLDILRVQEIRGWEPPTELPNTPEYIKGVINMRGAVVPIVDLRQRFKIGEVVYNDATVVIITHFNYQVSGSDEVLQKTIGLVVDGVSDVYDVNLAELQPAPSFGDTKRVSGEFVKGLATLDHTMIIILNVDLMINQGIYEEVSEFLAVA
ncbi:chemotaxis protein CheW [Thiomicrospira sp. ALE5]|uniref:chemotaxis protein CheW n=1 Tax=Thiomicrospira sp. ALE5 TaxID=748650 RepID=UPI0008E89CED|nr:chemotaxis protein CheW [Thiomicrospira sp. ALE5]SFR54824.1 purine-binding chemotaxis protein CheW [Thiomicrospira sp. ALE5]